MIESLDKFHLLKWCGVVAVCFLCLCSCGVLSPEDAERLMFGLDNALEQGQITEAQHAAAREAILDKTSFDWSHVIEPVVTLVAGYFGIRVWRGSPTARKGQAPQIAGAV